MIGVTAGSLLLLIGLSGAVLSFREELLDALNPGGRQVAPRAQSPLTPDGLLEALTRAHPHDTPTILALYAEPGRAARVVVAPRRRFLRDRRGLASLAADAARARPRRRRHAGHRADAAGDDRAWPRKLTDWRQWWQVDPKLEGRALWRRLHLVVGTACLPLYLVLTATGIYWSFDAVRDPVSAWLGEPRAPRAARRDGLIGPPLPAAAVGRRPRDGDREQ